ncbi:ligand-binding sensor domain-containing protein [Arachidicoccus ginsenosidivorans]
MRIYPHNYFWIILVCFVLVAPFNLRGQQFTKPEVINYPKSTYKAEGQNWSVTQDENRIMYFGNNQGLLRYDGEQWQLFTLPQKKVIRSVAADHEGKIFSGAFGEFGYWQKNLYGTMHYHSLNHLFKNPQFKEEEIWKIIPTANQVLFQSFSHIYSYRDGKVSSVSAPGTIMFMFPVQGKIYVDILGKGIFSIGDDLSLTAVCTDEPIRQLKVTFILPYGANDLLIGTEKSGMYCYNLTSESLRRFKSADDTYFIDNEINNGVEISDNRYAIGTISAGIVLMDSSGRILKKLDRSNGLQNNTIINLIKDKDGNCWLALDKGIAQLILHSNIEYYLDLDGHIGTVYSVALFQGHIYIGTNHGLFSAPFSDLASFDKNKLTRVPTIINQVWGLKVIDSLLFCSFNSGTAIINNGKVRLVTDTTGSWDMEPMDGAPDRLVQGTYFGVAIYKKENGRWQFSNYVHGTENQQINRLVFDKDGVLWLKHAYNGIFAIKLSPDLKSVQVIREIAKAKNLPKEADFSFFKLDGNVYLNDKSGIYTFDFKSNTIKQAPQINQRLGPYVNTQTIIADGNSGLFLIGDDNSITYKNNQTGAFQTFAFNSKLFGLVAGYENITPYTATKSFVGGEEGFVVLNKNGNSSLEDNRPPAITAIEVLSRNKKAFIDSSFIQGKDKIKLPYNKNGLILHFSAMCYTQSTQYSYCLDDGTNATWSDWTRTAVKEYDNLAPGNYIFRLKSKNTDNITTLYITVQNPWYWTSWFKALYLLLAILLIYLLVKWHRHRLNKQRLLLTKRMREEIAMQRQKNEHEILLLKQAQLSEEVVHKSEDLAKIAMDLIKKKNILKKLKAHLQSIKDSQAIEDIHAHIQKISKVLEKNAKDEENEWHLFDNGFNKVHEDFFDRLIKAYPELTAQDLRLAAYLRMNLTTKEIAPLLNISTRGVEIKRYRLRKKIHLDEHENLNDYMIRF